MRLPTFDATRHSPGFAPVRQPYRPDDRRRRVPGRPDASIAISTTRYGRIAGRASSGATRWPIERSVRPRRWELGVRTEPHPILE